VISLDLDSYGRPAVAVMELGLEGVGFPRPEALALEEGGARLLVLTDDDPSDGLRELRGIDLGGPELGEVFEITAELPDGVRALSTGPDGLRLVALESSNDLAVGGGVEQVRSISAYDARVQAVTVSVAFDPVPSATEPRRWRWSKARSAPFATDPGGVDDFLVWDSEEVLGGGDVYLKLTPYDSDGGVSHALAVPKAILAAQDVGPSFLEGLFSPIAVASADLNGDGLLDLVCANNGASELVLYYATGPGEFPPDPSDRIGDALSTAAPISVAIADLNADGRLDIVSANTLSSNLTVFRQTPFGKFLADPDLTLGDLSSTNRPTHVVAADLNGDCLLDLVSANVVGNNLTVFFQGPAVGSFPTSPSLTIGSSASTLGPRSVCSADLNEDGLLDLACANANSNTLAVFFQSGSGQFPLAPSRILGGTSTTSSPQSIAAADLNGDGLSDLVSANLSSRTLTVFFQDPLGQFPTEPDRTLEAFSNGAPSYVVPVDLDGDGGLDLVATNNFSERLTVHFQSGPGEFSIRPDLILGGPDSTGRIIGVACGDFDGDGLVDLAAAGFEAGNLAIFLQRRLGAFPDVPDLGVGVALGSHVVADLNGDGLIDLAFSGIGGPTVFFQSGLGRFPPIPSLSLGVNSSRITAADMDGNGLIDLVTAEFSTDLVTVFFQTSPGQFPLDQVLQVGGSPWMDAPTALAVEDLDGDAKLDIAVASLLSDNLCLFLQRSPGQFPQAPDWILGNSATTDAPRALAIADLNGDGLLDFALTHGPGLSNHASVFFQTNDPSFPLVPDLTMGGAGATEGMFVVITADLNGDGRIDVATANQASHNLTVFFQSDQGGFPGAPSLVLGGPGLTPQPVALAAVDLNRDGQLDLVSSNAGGSATTFLQEAPGRFLPTPSSAMALTSPGTLSVADINGDGQPDLLVVAGSETLVFFGH
jgi:hypothetical protein